MTNGLFSMFSSLIANTPPYRKGLSSRKFLSLFLILFLAVGNAWGQETVIYSTDVKENPNSPATATTGKASYSTTSVDWASAYSNYLKTTGSDGYYQLDFNPVIDLTAYVDIKIKIYWGATANRPLKISIDNGTSTEIDKVGSSSERSKVREIELELSANSIKTIKLNSSGGGNVFLFRIEIVGTSTSSGGGDPVDPTFTYTPTTYTIGDPALDLSTKLTSNSGGAISFAVSTADAGTTGASIANGKDFTATTAGTATITVTQAETTGYNAKTQDIAVSVVEPDPCTTYYHFVATADATANGKTNWSGFTNAPTGSDGQDNSVTIDGTTYTLKKRTGSTGKGVAILGFTIPANKAGTLYGYMKSSGSAGRTLSLKKGDEVVATNTEIVDGNWTLITINAIPQGTYTLIPNDNVRIQMFALKVCDAVFHTVTFNSNGGSSVVEQSVLDGAPAIQPTDPERGKYTFLGWFVGETLYDWATPVASDLTLTAKWQNPWSITFDSNGGSAIEPITVKHNTKAEKPSDPTKVNYNFEGWFYGEPATPFDWNANITQDYTLKAQWIDDNNVARIGDTYYTNLDEAVAYANANADAEIILLKDIDRADRITLTKSTTINLNGNKLSKTDGGWLIFVKEGATLTINGETENSAVYGGISLGAMTNNNGSLVINGGTYTCADGVACVHVNGTCLESNVTINGANLNSPTDIAVQLNGKGTYTITNATITGATGVYIKSGELTVTNSTIKGTKTPADYSYTGNGANATGDAIVVDACDYPGGAPTLNIISGTFEGTKGAVGNYNYNGTSAPAIGGIQGGTFNTEVPADLCADGYIPVKNGENNYGVTKTAKTFSLEDLVTTQGTGADYEEYLNNLGWSVANANALDNLNTEKDYDNYPYLGLKFKSAAGYVEGVVEGDKLLTIQLGHMAADADLYENGTKKVSLSGKDAETAAVHYYYVENQSTIKLQMTNDGTCVLKAVTITDPFTVTFNAQEGSAVAALKGKPSITLPEPTNGTMNFKGWYDAATEGNKIGDAGEEYTPTADVTIYAQWEAQSTINTLSDLKVNGETVLGFAANEHTYRMVLPYKSALPMITSATPTNANATFALWPVDGPEWTDEYDGGCYRQQVVVTPQDPTAEKGYYDIRITIAPKDGVSIIKVATTGGTNKTVTGLYAGDGDVNLSSNMKMDNGKYIGFTLAGTTLQAGDRINVHTTTASNSGGSHIIFYDNMTDKTELYDTGEIGGKGDNIFTINAAMVGSASAYVYRADTDNAHKWNGYIDFIEVLRPMNPVLTAITFDGNAAEMGVGNTFSVTLQNGTDLNAMTVVPTIVKNGEGGSATPLVAWAWGENTYRVTDKDGDYTDYTITLTEAASPSAAPVITTQPADGNYIEGETITALKVVATGSGELSYQWYLGAEAIDGATAATYTPTVDAIGLYVYHCVVTNTEAGHPATSLVSSDATITIAEDPAAIKLLNNAGAINTTDFITGVSATTVNFNDAVHNCATFGSTASTVVGASGLNKYIIYNSKTTQTKIKFVLYNVQNASVTMKLQKLVEGGTEMEEVVINVPSKEVFTTDFYTFDGSANRTMYAFVQNTGIKVLQVKVIDNGTPLKQFGEVGYSINFNKGRLFLASGNEIAYDGLTYNASSNYAPLNNEGLSLASSKSYRFEVPADVTMTVTAANNKKYYITDKEDGSDNETATAEARSFDLTAGTWYLRVDGSNLGLTKIEFTAPICNLAITTQPESNTNFGAGDMTATVVAASSTDGATLAYQWYNVSDDSEVSGANTETLTTTTPGEYYVVITSSKTGYQDKVIKSNTIELGYRDLTIATLGALSQGGNAITLEDGVYEYNVYLVEGTTVVPALAATATQAPYGATAVPTNAAAFDNYEAVSTVLVTAEDGTTTQTYTVHFYVAHEILALVDVTGNMTWDFSKANDGTAAEKGLCNEVIFANVDGINNNDDFESDNLMVTANKFSNGKLQASMIKFHTTVDGVVKVMFSHTGNDKVDGRALVVNGTYQSALSYNQTVVMYSCFVPAGDVILTVTTGDGGSMLNFTNVDFKAKVTPDYTRNQMLGNGVLGTICLPFNVPSGAAFGATFYELQGREPQYGKLVFDEIVSGELEAGKPYVFQAHGDVINIFYGDTQVSEPVNTGNGMYGTFTDITLTELADVYYFAQRALWSCTDLTSLSIPANRAYVKLSEIAYLTPAQQNPAPGVRRITMAVNGQNTTTGFENIDVTDKPVKMIIDGQLYIIRGEKAYDAQGKLVK